MLCTCHKQSKKWETYLCPDIHKKIEESNAEGQNLYVGHCDGDFFEVLDQNNNSINLRSRIYSCHRWQLYSIPLKHAFATIMQTDTSVHYFVSEYFTVQTYQLAYEESIFSIPDNYKMTEDNRELQLRLPIMKKQPRRKRIESQEFTIHELHWSSASRLVTIVDHAMHLLLDSITITVTLFTSVPLICTIVILYVNVQQKCLRISNLF